MLLLLDASDFAATLTPMLLLSPILLLLAAALTVLVLRVARRLRFAYVWLAAALGTLAAWPLLFWLGSRLPLETQMPSWEPAAIFLASPALIGDNVSWQFGMALAALLIAVFFSDVARTSETAWFGWAGSLVIGALALAAVFSANILTLLLAWAALDLAELTIQFTRTPAGLQSQPAVRAFAMRLAGGVLLLLGGVAAQPGQPGLAFADLSPFANLLVMAAAIVRLGVSPITPPDDGEWASPRGQDVLLRLAPAASALMLLARTAVIGAPAAWRLPLFALAGVLALYTAARWSNTQDELEGFPHWAFATAALALGAAVRAEPQASMAWGLASLLSGGLLFLFSTRGRALTVLPILGLIGFSTFPFTPAWDAVDLYSAPFLLAGVFFLAAQAFLLIGYAFHALRPTETLKQAERWVMLVYPLGLFMLPLTHFLIVFIGRPLDAFPALRASWPGLAAALLAAVLLLVSRFVQRRSSALQLSLRRPVYGPRKRLDVQAERLPRGLPVITRLLEGQGGLLWAFLTVILLLSWLLSQQSGG